MQRKALPSYIPRWTEEFNAYTRKQSANWEKSFHPAFSRDDLYQEAYLVFLDCKRRYFGKVDNPAWFMSLYKKSLQNHYRSLYTNQQRHAPRALSLNSPAPSSSPEEELSGPELPTIGEAENAGTLLAIVEEAPYEVRAVIRSLLTEDIPQALGPHGFTNIELCRLIGVPSGKRNLVMLMQRHLAF